MATTMMEPVLPELESWSVDEFPPRVADASPPQVERSDISFGNVSKALVRIAVRVRNRSPWPSQATEMNIQAAPFGAFVPWSPLTTMPVPGLAAGAAVDLQTDVPLSPTRPLGDFARVPPSRLLTAISPDDESRRGVTGRTNAPSSSGRLRPALLPPDLFRLVGQGSVHWAGNLNIFIGGRAVERHMAMALRIYPGRTNLAMFVVGSGRDAYRFELSGTGTAWDPGLFDMTAAVSLRGDLARHQPVQDEDWLTVEGRRMMLLAVSPPDDCGEGELAVHVTQRSSGQTAVVEFGFDPAAEAPGCYTL
jgi:hypothetical protein